MQRHPLPFPRRGSRASKALLAGAVCAAALRPMPLPAYTLTGSTWETSPWFEVDPGVQVVAGAEDAIQRAFEQSWYCGCNVWGWADSEFHDGDVSYGGNGDSEVYWSADAAVMSGSPTVTLSWYAPGDAYGWWETVESDILLNSNQAWTTYDARSHSVAYGGSYLPLESAVLQALGFALGLGAEDGVYNSMGYHWEHAHTNGDTARPGWGEDATAGLRALYGDLSNDDVAVSHWKWAASVAGTYSDHKRVQLYSTGGSALSATTDAGEPLYSLAKGQSVLVEVTLENNGYANVTTPVSFYLSTNSTISTFDKLLASATYTLGPNTPYTTKWQVTLPTSLTAGQKYWLGAVIDPSDALADEWDQTDNAGYLVAIKPY